MSVAVPDRRVTAPKPQRGRRDRTGSLTAGASPSLFADGHQQPAAQRELRWIRHRDEWLVELVVVVPDESGLAPV